MRNSYKLLDVFAELDTKSNSNEFSNIIQSNNINDILSISGSFFYIIFDVPRNTFQYVSPWIKHVLGYSQDEFLIKGTPFFNEICHPEVRNSIKSINTECFNFLKTKSVKFYPHYKFSFDILVRDASGDNVRLLQHNRFIKVDKSGNPILLLAIFMKIHQGNNDIKQTLQISRMMPKGERILLKKDFYPQFENGILTKTEIEVWRLTADGLSGKEIASQLGIAVNTVNTHKKNISKKLKNS